MPYIIYTFVNGDKYYELLDAKIAIDDQIAAYLDEAFGLEPAEDDWSFGLLIGNNVRFSDGTVNYDVYMDFCDNIIVEIK